MVHHPAAELTIATLLTWSDRGAGPRAHHTPRAEGDRGPVLRLLDHQPPYDRLLVLTTPAALRGARALVREADPRVGRIDLRLLDVDDPSDHAALFDALRPVVDDVAADTDVDVLLSAGTPQAQTLWVILVQAGLLRARMLQVIPPAFVPDPHPHPVREVRLDIEGFPEIRALRAEVRRLRAEAAWPIVGEAPALLALRRRMLRIAPSRVPVLVQGETGTGKELVARALHDASDRADGPFVAANCGAFAEGVLASELFGHEAGAFTGATRRHRGLFEQASGGTLFLDEVGEMPPRVQVSLLRVLETGRLRRVGAEGDVGVDVRVVAATHRDLTAGGFREDLYFRLRGAELRVPPLRERGTDLERLVAHFLAEASARLAVAPEAWEALRGWAWPGNVRELRAEVVRWTLLCDSEVRPVDLAPEIRGLPRTTPAAAAGPEVRPLAEVVAEVERAAIDEALRVTSHNLSRTARALGIDRNTLKRKLRLLARGARSSP
jgi:two-component system, NtrC family, response regulator AtoC